MLVTGLLGIGNSTPGLLYIHMFVLKLAPPSQLTKFRWRGGTHTVFDSGDRVGGAELAEAMVRELRARRAKVPVEVSEWAGEDAGRRRHFGGCGCQ